MPVAFETLGRRLAIGQRFTDRLANAPRRIEIDGGRAPASAVAAAVQIEHAFDLAEPNARPPL